MRDLPLSVLDQSPIRKGGTAAQALQETLQLAEACDRLGYRRYWVAEHHNSGGLAGASPEILIGQIAARTRDIRAGSGGVMLTHYSPLKVAEQFRMLEALFPGRIDLGVGRAPGSDFRTAAALAGFSVEQFPQQLQELQAYLTTGLPEGHPHRGIRAMPDGVETPELWTLGSTTVGAELAAQLGWGFAFAHFINPGGGEDVIRAYKRTFRPSPAMSEPHTILAVSATCADTDEEAERLSWSRWAWRIMSSTPGASRGGIPPVEEAINFPYTVTDRAYLAHFRERSVSGSPATVKARLLELAEEYDADEVMIVTITYDFAARVHSYELIADAFGLSPTATAAATG